MQGSAAASVARRLLAEGVGAVGVSAAVVGSGIMAQRLSPTDIGVQLLENVLAIVFAIGALIVLFTPVSGAHFNPVISAVDWFLGRRDGSGLTGTVAVGYIAAQFVGAFVGAVLANVMFDLPAVEWSSHYRAGWGVLLGEVVATAGLVLLVFALSRSGQAARAPVAVPAYIAAAAWFTSSTSFVNPALTLARSATDTFTGISPRSLPGFVGAQLVGLLIGVLLVKAFYPDNAVS